jgi:glyceraldehyde-3-phosphate dehydrogenase (NADP+)
VNAGIAKLTVGMPEDDAAIVPVVSKSATLCQEYKREGNLIWPLLIDKVSGARATGGDCQLVPHAA